MDTKLNNTVLAPNEKSPVDTTYEIVDKYVSSLETAIKNDTDKNTLIEMLMEFYQAFDEHMTEVRNIYEYLQNEK